MTLAQTHWPSKSSVLQNGMMDSTRWDGFAYRPDDIVVASPGKAGTTWVQQAVAQLVFDGEDAPVSELSPWLEFVAFPKDEVLQGLEAQTHRRMIKTHLPVDAIGLRPDVKYLYVARDGRDVAFSMHPFYVGFGQTPQMLPDGTVVRRHLPNPDPRGFFLDWISGEAEVIAPFFPNVTSWWEVRALPNVRLVHYNNMKAEMAGEIAAIADFLEIEPSVSAWPRILEHCSFDYMKQNAQAVGPMGARRLEGGATAFFHQGSNGRWRDVLTADDLDLYQRAVAANLAPDCAHWLATGEMPD